MIQELMEMYFCSSSATSRFGGWSRCGRNILSPGLGAAEVAAAWQSNQSFTACAEPAFGTVLRMDKGPSGHRAERMEQGSALFVEP